MDTDLYVAVCQRPRKRRREADEEPDARWAAPAIPAHPRSLTMQKVLTLCSGIEAVIQGYENLLDKYFEVIS